MKKGFTLIELLVVIAILGMIALITTPIIINIINDSKDKALENQKSVIISAARTYAADNSEVLAGSESTCINISQLQQKGYLSVDDIKNPKTKDNLDGSVRVTYQENNNKYNYIYNQNQCDE